MTWPVRVKSVAEAEFAEAAVWYYRRSPEAAESFVAGIEATLGRIGTAPELFPIIHGDIRRARVHTFPYSVYFVQGEKECVVLAIHHGKRHPRRWLRRSGG